MGRQEVATLKNLLAPPKRDKVWPAEKFDLRKHSKFPRLVHVLAFNSLSGKWGFHSLRSLREVPTYLVPERGMKRAERIRPFETYSFSMKKKVTLHFFARLEPGMDLRRAQDLGRGPMVEHYRLMVDQKMDALWAYRYICQYYPGSMWENYTYPHNRRVTNIYEKVAPRIKYLPDSEDEEEKTSNK